MKKVYLDKTCTKIIGPVTDSVEIDKEIALLIMLLNRKGYKTLFCCAGHDDKNPYISFEYSIKTVELCNHIFDTLSEKVRSERITFRVSMLSNVKTISIYSDGKPKYKKWLDNVTKCITNYLLVNDDWIKNRIEFYKNYPFEQDFLNQWPIPTDTE